MRVELSDAGVTVFTLGTASHVAWPNIRDVPADCNGLHIVRKDGHVVTAGSMGTSRLATRLDLDDRAKAWVPHGNEAERSLVTPTELLLDTPMLPLEATMTIPFGPQLVGETEKTLTALLRRFLAESGLTEPQWVTLRVAQLYGADDTEGLAAAVADRAHFPDASELVGSLTDRGMLEAGRLTPAGRDVISSVLATSERETGGLWRDHAAADVEATTRVLNEVLARARVRLD